MPRKPANLTVFGILNILVGIGFHIFAVVWVDLMGRDSSTRILSIAAHVVGFTYLVSGGALIAAPELGKTITRPVAWLSLLLMAAMALRSIVDPRRTFELPIALVVAVYWITVLRCIGWMPEQEDAS